MSQRDEHVAAAETLLAELVALEQDYLRLSARIEQLSNQVNPALGSPPPEGEPGDGLLAWLTTERKELLGRAWMVNKTCEQVRALLGRL